MSTILSLDRICKSYGAVVVADSITLEVVEGGALGIIGPNGAGKTSLFNLITGTVRADSGAIEFDGRPVTSVSAADRSRAGIARSFQIPQPFGGMTVFENLLVAAVQRGGAARAEARAHSLDVLERTGLIAKANVRASTLTLLERKRLEIARALASRPRLLLLDEIAGGLTERECESLVALIGDLGRHGITIVWIEHVVHALLAVVGRLVVLDFGRVIADGEPAATMRSDVVREKYMGLSVDA